MADVAEEPCSRVNEVGEALMVKLGGGVTISQ